MDLAIQNHQDRDKLWCCLFLKLWKNANHSLLDSIFYSELCKYTRVSDCPLSSLEHFFALIPRHTSFSYSINNGFKLILGRVNFVIVLNHDLYISLTLIALMTDVVLSSGLYLGVLIQKLCLHLLDNYGNDVLDFD